MKNLFKSLANFQQEVPTILKTSQGYGYVFADLPTILEKINPLLKKHGLGFSQLIQGSQIETILFHSESGEMLKSLTNIPQGVQLKGMNDFQVLGSAITYLRRYSLSSILGLVTDKDTDASGEQKKEQKKEVLTNYHPNFEKIKDALRNGTHTIEQVKSKYQVSNEIEELLKLKTA